MISAEEFQSRDVCMDFGDIECERSGSKEGGGWTKQGSGGIVGEYQKSTDFIAKFTSGKKGDSSDKGGVRRRRRRQSAVTSSSSEGEEEEKKTEGHKDIVRDDSSRFEDSSFFWDESGEASKVEEKDLKDTSSIQMVKRKVDLIEKLRESLTSKFKAYQAHVEAVRKRHDNSPFINFAAEVASLTGEKSTNYTNYHPDYYTFSHQTLSANEAKMYTILDKIERHLTGLSMFMTQVNLHDDEMTMKLGQFENIQREAEDLIILLTAPLTRTIIEQKAIKEERPPRLKNDFDSYKYFLKIEFRANVQKCLNEAICRSRLAKDFGWADHHLEKAVVFILTDCPQGRGLLSDCVGRTMIENKMNFAFSSQSRMKRSDILVSANLSRLSLSGWICDNANLFYDIRLESPEREEGSSSRDSRVTMTYIGEYV